MLKIGQHLVKLGEKHIQRHLFPDTVQGGAE